MPVSNYVAGHLIQCNAEYTTEISLTSALVQGNSYTTLATSPLPAPVVSGDLVTLTGQAGASQVVTVATAGALLGATSIPVNSFVANTSYASGPPGSKATVVSYLVDPSTVTFTYTLGEAGATPNDFLYSSGGSGIGVVLRVSKGVYLFWLDSTGITARSLTYDWPSTGVGQTLDGGRTVTITQPRVT